MRANFKANFLLDDLSLADGASVSVKKNGSLVDLFDKDGNAKPNPVTATSTGWVDFYVNAGRYDLTIAHGQSTKQIDDVQIGDNNRLDTNIINGNKTLLEGDSGKVWLVTNDAVVTIADDVGEGFVAGFTCDDSQNNTQHTITLQSALTIQNSNIKGACSIWVINGTIYTAGAIEKLP